MKSFFVILTLLAALPAFSAKLELKVTNLSGKSGKVFYTVIKDPKQFPDGNGIASGSVAVNGSQAEIQFNVELPPGSYAISTFLDENGNARIDTRFKIPTERFGFSNNPKLKFGPPSFSDCEVRVQEVPRNSISIKVKPFKEHIGI